MWLSQLKVAKIVFFGTGRFGALVLEQLTCKQAVSLVITTCGKSHTSEVGGIATSMGIKTIAIDDPHKEEVLALIREVAPDYLVLADYGKILKRKVLELVSRRLNVHPSLLPKYRGAAPIQWAIINGDEKTGVTVLDIAPKVDAGDIYAQVEVTIGPHETYGELRERLGRIGGNLLVDIIEKMNRGEVTPTPQDESMATYASKIKDETARIDWYKPAHTIFNLIRGLNPQPGAYTYFRGRRLKIWKALPKEGDGNVTPGTVISVKPELAVQTGDGVLVIRELQPEYRKVMDVIAFINGYRPWVGEVLG